MKPKKQNVPLKSFAAVARTDKRSIIAVVASLCRRRLFFAYPGKFRGQSLCFQAEGALPSRAKFKCGNQYFEASSLPPVWADIFVEFCVPLDRHRLKPREVSQNGVFWA